MSEQAVFDTGLQAERTALAWRRTALALAVGSVGAGRLAAPALGVAALVLGVLGLAQAALVTVTAGRRYASAHRSLISRGDLRDVGAGALPIAALAGSGLVVAVLALTFVLTR